MALVAVLLVLAALLALSAPFLMSVRASDAASARLADETSARLALDAASRHARTRLAASHAAVDSTPRSDGPAELDVTPDFDAAFWDPSDPNGVMWNVEATDLAGRIDPTSAPPQLFANLLNLVTRLGETAEAGDARLALVARAGLSESGIAWLNDELVSWGAAGPRELFEVQRGLGASEDTQDCGPRAPRSHPIGSLLFGETAMALAEWRLWGAPSPVSRGGDERGDEDGADRRAQAARLRPYASLDELESALRTSLSFPVGSNGEPQADRVARALTRLSEAVHVHAGTGAGPRWQQPTRIVRAVQAGECRIAVRDARWFNVGTTVRIAGPDGSELALVRRAEGGLLELMQPLRSAYRAFDAEVAALARVPVNLNTASSTVLSALFANLELRGANGWVTPSEAEELAALVQASRPLAGFEDFLRRVLLPAAGIQDPDAEGPEGGGAKSAVKPFLGRADAIAIYKNGRNANDAELSFSTLPFCFASRDVHALETRAVVNAPSGVARRTLLRDEVRLAVPQQDLLSVFTRQGDFDALGRLDGSSGGWLSGPENTLRHDRFQTFGRPSEVRAELGELDTAPVSEGVAPDSTNASSTGAGGAGVSVRSGLVFSDEERAGYVQLAPSRAHEIGTPLHRRAGRVLHFDDDAGSPEGRYLAEDPVFLEVGPAPVDWLDADGFLAPFTFESWVRFGGGTPQATLFDLGGVFSDSDRVQLLLEDDALVLRVHGPAPDHPATEFLEVGEVRYPLTPNADAAAPRPGLPLDTWAHVAFDVSGNRADQITLRVDGRFVGPGGGQGSPAQGQAQGQGSQRGADRRGLTELALEAGAQDELLVVVSTAGFPERCTLQIGRELVEVVVEDETTFRATRGVDGARAGFGGRMAREVVFGNDPRTNIGELEKDGVHAAGTPVALYGYSAPLASHVPASSARLRSALGPFSVARLVGVTGSNGEPVRLELNDIVPTTIGLGMVGQGSQVDGLLLDIADPEAELDDVLDAFSADGGYAVLLGPFAPGQYTSAEGDPVGGAEVIRYSGITGNRLVLAARGDQVGELERLRGSELVQRQAFLYEWNEGLGGVSVRGVEQALSERLDLATFVVPISIPAPAPVGGLDFLADEEESGFAQITRVGDAAHLSEWVRYDEGARGSLVRSDPVALLEARNRAHGFQPRVQALLGEVDPSEVEPGGSGGASSGGASGVSRSAVSGALGSAAAPVQASSQQGFDPFLWDSTMGAPEDLELPLTRAVASALQHRGVFGTSTHRQPLGALVLPVWKARAGLEESTGWPGRFDAVTLFDGDPTQPGFPGVVHRAYRPFDRVEETWQVGTAALSSEFGEAVLVEELGVDRNAIYIALQEPLDVPVVPEFDDDGLVLDEDSRLNARVTAFPSGELPRTVPGVALGASVAPAASVGTSVAGGASGLGSGPPDAVMDEAAFGRPRFADFAGGVSLVLETELGIGDGDPLDVLASVLRGPFGEAPDVAGALDTLPQDALVLRIGDELVCVRGGDATGRFPFATGGRGLLGTQPQPHAAGEPAVYQSGLPVTVLSGSIDADDPFLPIADPEGFPPHGLVRIDDELIHYTHIVGGALAMPRASRRPGEMDGRGAGLFRGRFGTDPAGHAADAPVVLFPFRYPDRWAERADASELAYFTVRLDQPSAFWRGIAWEVEDPAVGGPRLGILQRSDPTRPWDAPPRAESGLELFSSSGSLGSGSTVGGSRTVSDAMSTEGMTGRQLLGFQADALEWRVFVQHDPGAFDAQNGLSHAWKTTPRLTLFAVEWFAPHLLLARMER